jgi:YfiH family protein
MELFCKNTAAAAPSIHELSGWMSRYPQLRAGISSRHGGVSTGHYRELNVGLHVGDDPNAVVENRRRLASAAGIDFAAWTFAEQVHGNRVTVVTQDDKGAGRESLADVLPGADGLVTGEAGICLAALYADCVPLYFYDPEHRAIGMAHAGWRGTVGQIGANVVETMTREFGSRPHRLLAAIGPSIGSCCYEVGEQVVEEVRQTIVKLEVEDHGTILQPRGDDKFMLDLQQLNRQIMIKAGILPSNIEITGLCTGCRTDEFYSHRRENGSTGRMIAWIGMVDDGHFGQNTKQYQQS